VEINSDPSSGRFPMQIEMPRTMSMLARQQVFSYWRGPRNIDAVINAAEQFHGWQTLALDVRMNHGLDPEFESRSVYGIIHNESEESAILRAVYWNQSTERRKMMQHGFNYVFGMPARFVRVSADQLRTWVTCFAGVSIFIDPTWGTDVPEPIRRLRIESDYYASILETTWATGAKADRELDQRWETVWEDMTKSLRSAPVVHVLQEKYPTVEGTPRYDLDAYRPDAFRRHSDG